MRSAIALIAVLAAVPACKKHPPEIQTQVKFDGAPVTRAATFDDLADPKPSLTFQSFPADMQGGLTAALPPDPSAKITVTLVGDPPKAGDGKATVTVKVAVKWFALPDVRTAEGTGTLTMEYWSSDGAALGRDIADHVAKFLRDNRPDRASAPTPAPVAKAVAVGNRIACSLHADGTVHCWGDPTGSGIGPVPTDTGIKDAVEIGAGDFTVCARLSGGTHNGEIECVGGKDAKSRVHTHVCKLPAEPTQIAVGGETGCALLKDGTVHCWPLYTQNSTAPNCQRSAYPVTGVAGASAIAVGFQGGCALQGATLQCWQAEQGATSALDSGDMSKLGPATQPLYGFHPCGLTADGKLNCLDGKTNELAPAVTVVPAGSKITMAPTWGCAIPADGTLLCFGQNNYHQIEPSGTDHAEPVKINGLAHVTSVDMASSSACAVADGAVYCWGGGIDGHPAPLGVAASVQTRPAKIAIY
ncbi:MAG TPA: RCC1 domain-containing protein [Kofleriaceae bacterium]|jgi:hypothetical protein